MPICVTWVSAGAVPTAQQPFLSNFVGRVERWAHLDIAGPAYQASREAAVSGATGYGVQPHDRLAIVQDRHLLIGKAWTEFCRFTI